LLLGQIGGRTSESALPGTEQQKQENQKKARKRVAVEPLIKGVKTFRIAAARFRLNSSSCEPVILAVCGLIRWRIGAIVFNNYQLQTGL